MLRRRTIAAAPQRSASATWQVISELVTETVAVSSALSRADAEQAMLTAAPAGRALVAGGHLDQRPVTLVAGSVHCEITTVSGEQALHLEENRNPVPGAAGATEFTVYLPAPEPLQTVVADAVAGHPALSDAEPPAHTSSRTRTTGSLVDLTALRREFRP